MVGVEVVVGVGVDVVVGVGVEVGVEVGVVVGVVVGVGVGVGVVVEVGVEVGVMPRVGKTMDRKRALRRIEGLNAEWAKHHPHVVLTNASGDKWAEPTTIAGFVDAVVESRGGVPKKRRHRWNHTVPHHAVCERCGIHCRKIWYPGGRGSSSYYDREGLYLGTRAPECVPSEPK